MNIIKSTVSSVIGEKFEVLKSKPYFGHLMRIIKIYSNIQTTNEHIIHAIRENSDLWARVAKEIIKPYEDVSSKELGSYNIPFAPPLEHRVRQGSEIPVVSSRVGVDINEDYTEVTVKNDNKFKSENSIFEHDEEYFRNSLGKSSDLKSFVSQVIQNT